MKYKYLEPCNDIDTLYEELRINVIRVNNTFCTEKYEEDGKYCLDLFGMFHDPMVDIHSIINLALQLEGVEEAMEDNTEAERWEALKIISRKLEIEMNKLP